MYLYINPSRLTYLNQFYLQNEPPAEGHSDDSITPTCDVRLRRSTSLPRIQSPRSNSRFPVHERNSRTPSPDSERRSPDPGSLAGAGEELDASDNVPGPNTDFENLQGEDNEDEPTDMEPILKELKDAQFFIDAIKDAKLDESGLDEACLHRIRNPPQRQADEDIDPLLKLSIDIFLATGNASQATYTAIKDALIKYDPTLEISSHAITKKRIADITGVLPLRTDMCVNTCIAYTGPFSNFESCKECNEPRYDLKQSTATKKVPRRQFLTIPLGTQIQALFRSPESAKQMCYRTELTAKIMQELGANNRIIDVYEDIFHGKDYLTAVGNGIVTTNDILLMFSIDGAQLYAMKASDCWIAIWVILNQSPELRFKKIKVLPAFFAGGPNKPKNMESFCYPSFFHLAALQNEGLSVWDASTDQVKSVDLMLATATGDGPAISIMGGGVGHCGAVGCRKNGCMMPGRRKEGDKTYYPAALKPNTLAHLL